MGRLVGVGGLGGGKQGDRQKETYVSGVAGSRETGSRQVLGGKGVQFGDSYLEVNRSHPSRTVQEIA